VICPRHLRRAPHAPYGWALCDECYAEARRKAEDMEVERIIARIRDRVRFEFGRKS